MNTIKRYSVACLLALSTLGTSALALAEPPAKPGCEGHEGKGHHEGKGKRAHFQRADKNHDGFLTKDEVGDQRWTRIQVADANKDGKLSRAEMQQARKDGKLHRHGQKA